MHGMCTAGIYGRGVNQGGWVRGVRGVYCAEARGQDLIDLLLLLPLLLLLLLLLLLRLLLPCCYYYYY